MISEKAVIKNEPDIWQIVKYAIENGQRKYNADEIGDKKIKKLLTDFGCYYIEVNYKNFSEGYDSTVILKRYGIPFFGIKEEIIADFAYQPRNYTTDSRKDKYHKFSKLSERIYYKKSEVPAM